MRSRIVLLGGAAICLAGFADPGGGGCGGDTTPSGVNAPCTRDKDCKAGLLCAGGVCEEPDAGAADGGGDAAAADTGSDAHTPADGDNG